jgi:hypothetical protein
MAQAQIIQHRLNSLVSKATQTGDIVEFCIQLNKNKRARLYYSESYKDYVLAFNINQSKSFILTRSMWKKFKKHLKNIDNELGR